MSQAIEPHSSRTLIYVISLLSAVALSVSASLATAQSATDLTGPQIGPQCFQVTPFSPVASTPVTDFKAAAQSLVDRLIRKGFRKIGQLDLAEFKKEIDQTKINYVPALKFFQADGAERTSACWSLIDGARNINVSLWQWSRTDADMRPVIAIHEFAGTARLNDQNYEVSSALAILAMDEATGLIEPEQIPALSHLSRAGAALGGRSGSRAGDQARGGGGIIGVGGGGDWIGSIAKLAFLKVGLDELRRARTPEERRAAIESMLEGNQWSVEVQWR